MDSLRPCPFCGNGSTDPHDLQALQIIEGEGTQWGQRAARLYYVRCGSCFARGGNGVTGYNALSGRYTDDEQARQIAINKWNRRPGNAGEGI